jgi:hypothetical protein
MIIVTEVVCQRIRAERSERMSHTYAFKTELDENGVDKI